MVTTITTCNVVDRFTKNILKILGMPYEIISDSDPKFLKEFGTKFFKMCKKIKLHITYRLPSDSQTEQTNRIIEVMPLTYIDKKKTRILGRKVMSL